MAFARIIVGTDGSGTATGAVRQAVDLARQHCATLIVVTAYEPTPEARLARERRDIPADLAHMAGGRDEAKTALTDAATLAAEAGVEAVTVARQGDPADALLDVAEEREVDLIVVGSKGMRGSKRFLLGSVPNKVSHHAQCSILIVRTV
jgi:nucleotide-binding universal stress UspA family protein